MLSLSSADIASYRDLSHDHNPLHTDPVYARRTPFGGCIAHGMLGTWGAIGAVAGDRPVRLRAIRCSFRAPLYADERYERRLESTGDGEARVTLERAGTKKLEVQLRYEAAVREPTPQPHAPRGEPLRTPEAPDPREMVGRTLEGVYEADLRHAARLSNRLGIPEGHIPMHQLQCLAWVSYFCGMRVPGRQSLIFSVQLEFSPPVRAEPSPLRYRAHVERYDPRFGRLEMAVSLSHGDAEICRGTVVVFSRPTPVPFRLEDTRAVVGESSDLAGKVALVTGASRGLGAHIAAALSLHGCRVALNYHRGEAEAEAVATSIRASGGEVITVQGDVTESGDCARMRAEIEAGLGRLDVLVNNASPPILPHSFSELSGAGVAGFVGRNVQAFVEPTLAFLPALVEARGWVVAVSSMYVEHPVAKFPHYVAAKAAVEGLAQGLALENPQVRCLIVRPPKLLTDQTNVNFDLEPRRSPAEVANQILLAVRHPAKETGIRTLRL